MRTWRRLLLAATCLAVAFGAEAPSSWGQASPTDPSGAGDPGAVSPNEEVVHSWALAPSGTAKDQPGDRSTLTYEAAPGAKIDDAVTLFNYSNVQLNFALYATDAFNDADGAFDLLPGSKKPKDVGTWITLAQNQITVPPRSQATIPITVKVPADASAGDHAGAVLASSPTVGISKKGDVVELDRRTGSRVYLRVDGPLDPSLVVESVKTDYKPALNPLSGSADVTYRIRNNGNVRLQGTHNVSVSGFLGMGKESTKVQKLPELLPGQDFTVHASFDGIPATGPLFTDVHLQPKSIEGDKADLPPANRRGIALAVPFTIILGALAIWMALRARRAYVQHRHDDLGVETQRT